MKQTWILLRQQTLLFFFFAIIAAMLLAPIASDTMVPMALDYINHINGIIQAKAALAEGQFPLRVAATDQEGWRYPLYQFYSPTSYWLASWIYRWLSPTNPFVAFKCTIWLAFVIGGIYMNRLTYWFVPSKPAAILASVVYLTAPYNIILVNHLGAFNESIAIGFLPVVIYYTLQRYYFPQQNKTLLQTALVWYLLCTIHFITFLCASFCVGGLLLAISLKHRQQWLSLVDVGIAYLFGCVLALWYLAPIGLLSSYLVVGRIFDNAAAFDARSPYISDLLAPVSSFAHQEGQGPSGLIDVITLSPPSFGMFALAGVLICAYVFFQRGAQHTLRERYWMPVLLGFFAVIFLLAWSPVHLWHFLPSSFRVIQSSWHLMGQSLWVSAVLFAMALTWLFQNKLDQRHVVIGILIILMTEGAWFPMLERGYKEFGGYIKNPMTVANPDAYLMDAQKYLPFINVIDSFDLDRFNPTDNVESHPLKLNHPYPLSRSSLVAAKQPFVLIKENIPAGTQLEHALLTAVVNDKVIATHALTTGPFEWKIPLPEKNTLLKLAHPAIEFHLDGIKSLTIPVTKIVLGGFLDESKTMDAKQTQSYCHQQQNLTVCKLNVPDSTHLIELPVLFYPKLLLVTLNGRAVSYKSVLYQGRLITGVVPEPGKQNIITVEFRGLPWANFMSGVTWSLWLFFLLFILVKRHQAKV